MLHIVCYTVQNMSAVYKLISQLCANKLELLFSPLPEKYSRGRKREKKPQIAIIAKYTSFFWIVSVESKVEEVRKGLKMHACFSGGDC